jgi:prepilin-type N-terminal cleavage/methylation domain-containing protein
MKRVGQASRRGFTIVELLIVIVVIGILAAITVAAFNGVQTRSENTKTAQAIGQYVKLLSNYATTYGVYPTSAVPPTAPPADFWTCLPYEPSSCASSSNIPSSCFGLNATSTHATFESELRKVATTLPAVSDKSTACSATQTFQGALVRIYNSGRSISIHFPQIGDAACPSIGGTTFGSRSFTTNTTRCSVSIPDYS